jgi:LDH2 family malate/lactate/ureidoglycolate dehydrogenase
LAYNHGAKIEIENETEAFAYTNRNWGWGLIICKQTMEVAIQKASKAGVE